MMRVALLTFGLLLAPALTGCAAGTASPGGTSVGPASARAQPAEQPLEWFVENWGPFDPALNAPGRPMLLLDGVQVRNADGGEASEVDPAIAKLTPDQIRKVRVVKCRSWLFGEAGRRGVIMIFTHTYDGPMPLSNPPPRTREDCRWRQP